MPIRPEFFTTSGACISEGGQLWISVCLHLYRMALLNHTIKGCGLLSEDLLENEIEIPLHSLVYYSLIF